MHLKYNECVAVKDMPHKDLLKEEINDLAFASCCSQAVKNPWCLSTNHQLRDKLQLVIRPLLGAAMVRVLQANLPLQTQLLFTKTMCSVSVGRKPHPVLPSGCHSLPKIKQEKALWGLLAPSAVRDNDGIQLNAM